MCTCGQRTVHVTGTESKRLSGSEDLMLDAKYSLEIPAAAPSQVFLLLFDPQLFHLPCWLGLIFETGLHFLALTGQGLVLILLAPTLWCLACSAPLLLCE